MPMAAIVRERMLLFVDSLKICPMGSKDLQNGCGIYAAGGIRRTAVFLGEMDIQEFADWQALQELH